jgi:glycine/D-amino acid oxidase-like deaminating enzyme
VNEYPYWWDTAPELAQPVEVPAPALPARVDVAIIGAGYTGLAAARQCAGAGASVVVLEREHIGWGASSRNGGQVLTGMKLDPAMLVARFGEAGARRLFDLSLEAIDALERLIAGQAIACEYRRSGHLQAAAKPSHFEAFREEQALLARVFDHRVELVSRAEQRAELGSDAYHGLLVDERSGAINPAQYAAGLAAAARRAGATIAGQTSVERLWRTAPGGPGTTTGGRGRWTVATSAGDIDAGDVLVATNGYTNGAAPELQRRLIPIGSYIIATEPLAAADAASLLPRGRMAFDSKNFLYYWRLTADRRLLFGGRAEFSRPDPETTRRAASILRTGLARVYPQLASARIEYAWGGNVAFTRDQIPHAGRLGGAYYAGGYCGHGIALATSLGTLIGRRMGGEAIEHPLMDDRFAAIPFYDGRPWFLPLVGAYYGVRDWLE